MDPALLRPGRLDKLLYVGVAEDVESKVKVRLAISLMVREGLGNVSTQVQAEKRPYPAVQRPCILIQEIFLHTGTVA